MSGAPACPQCGAAPIDPATVPATTAAAPSTATAAVEPVPARPASSGLGFRPMLGIAAVALVAVLAMGGVAIAQSSSEGSAPTEGIGSCWAAAGSSESYEAVECDDPSATYKIVSHVDDATLCTGEGYFEDGDGAYCTEAVTHG